MRRWNPAAITLHSAKHCQARNLPVSRQRLAGAVWIDKLDKLRPLAGVSLKHKEASLMIQYSGTDTHLTLSRSLSDNVSVSAIYWGMKYPGLGFRVRF